jgi:hypothetical protein
MRRIFAVNLLLALLTAMTGAATPVVPCAGMHAPGGAGQHVGHRMADVHRGPGKQESGSPHGATHSCLCPGVCGRSGVAFGLHQSPLISPVQTEIGTPPVGVQQFAPSPVARFLPQATGPPQRLRA